MEKDDVEYLLIDDNDDFESDFMLNNKSNKKETVISLDKDEDLKHEDIVIEKIKSEKKINNENIKKDNKNINIENKKTESKKRVKMKKVKTKKEKKVVKKSVFYTRLTFCLVSIAFIIGCCIFYGSRLIKYYRIFNPKTETGESITLIATSLTDQAAYQTEGDGLYRISGASIYKGEDVNNYFNFSNFLWRIVSINMDGTLELVLDENINILMFNNKKATFDSSDINDYLNNHFIKFLNTDYLSKTSYCKDEIENIQNVTCNETDNSSYVRLLGMTEFINGIVDNKSYLLDDHDYWLYNTYDEYAWHTNGTSISKSKVSEKYFVRPVIRLKNTNILLGGEGTKEKPYYIEKNKKEYSIGKYVLLDNDKWIIYDMDDKTLSLALDNTISNVLKFSNTKNVYNIEDKTSVAYYLNNKYFSSLSYSEIINTHKWNIGKYTNSYKDVEKETIEAKIGMYNVSDLKINNLNKMYYLLTPEKDGYVYFYDGDLISSRITLSRNIKPTININKFGIKSGDGSIDNPYVMNLEA